MTTGFFLYASSSFQRPAKSAQGMLIAFTRFPRLRHASFDLLLNSSAVRTSTITSSLLFFAISLKSSAVIILYLAGLVQYVFFSGSSFSGVAFQADMPL